MKQKESKSWLPILIILGLVSFSGAFALGFLDIKFPSKQLANLTKPTPSSVEKVEEEIEVAKREEEAGEKEIVPSIEPGLVAYYPFDKDVKDYSGEGNNGDNHDAVFVEGKSGEGLEFDGKKSFVYVPININPIVMPQMTMTAWVKENEGAKIMHVVSSDDAGYDRAMGTDNRGSGHEGWACFAGDGQVLLSPEPVEASKWTFIAAVYDQTVGTVKLFVNGSTYEKKGKIVGGGNDFVLIGARGSTKQQGEYFKGIIDEVRIYDSVLSDKELNSLYKTGIARP